VKGSLIVLSYLFWEKCEYSLLPIAIEIGPEGYRTIRGWKVDGAEDVPWKRLTNEARSKIENVLERVDFWDWERSYFNSDILDGTTWRIKVRGGRNGGRRKNSEGVNQFPGGWDEVEVAIMELDTGK
jgi:hypothetical protein